ncbi:MAG: T9SS type A sorting domain-containing protein [Flavobacteriaceae bacterium]|nr:T9SS type A sorting domain-containing protein [Flavobacteriaceae bacterium]
MKKNYCLLFFTLLFIQIMNSQNTVGTILNTENSLEGYTLFSPQTSLVPSYTYLMNNCGEVVNTWESTLPVYGSEYLMPDGTLFRSVVDNRSTLTLPGLSGRIEHLDWDGNLIWGVTFSDTDYSFHHDFEVLPNGNVLLTVAYRRTGADAIQAGRDPASLTEGELYEERIIELEPVGTDDYNIVWEWRSWDHLVQDFDETKDNYGVIADNPHRADMNFGSTFFGVDWWHTNSLDYSPERDQIILSNLGFNEFIIIDHSTTTAEAAGSTGGNSGMGGDIIYRWGNPQSYDRGDASDQVFNGQHNVQFIGPGLPNEGKILAFSNNDTPTSSSVILLTPPYDPNIQNYTLPSGEAYGPAEVDFEYVDPIDPDNFHSNFISGAQQLENGNILICSGAEGRLFEVDTDSNTWWDYRSPIASNQILADGENPDDFGTLVFRALKYPTDFPGFDGRDLTPMAVIEADPAEDGCELLEVIEYKLDQIALYPNPTRDILHLEIPFQDFTIEIYNTQGQRIRQLTNENTFDLSDLKSGMYFMKINTASREITRKFIKE